MSYRNPMHGLDHEGEPLFSDLERDLLILSTRPGSVAARAAYFREHTEALTEIMDELISGAKGPDLPAEESTTLSPELIEAMILASIAETLHRAGDRDRMETVAALALRQLYRREQELAELKAIIAGGITASAQEPA